MISDKLPLPTPDALAHSQKVLQHILLQLKNKGGSLSFAEFMDLALYAPELGYYRCGTQKFGASGDFVTAPEISSLFSYCLANQCAQIIHEMPKADILEIGAGSGQMAADILLKLENLNIKPNYYILELSADLRQRQQEKLKALCPHLFSQIKWLDKLPSQFEGIILANELLDALPCHRFFIENKNIYEMMVKTNNDELYVEPQKTNNPHFLNLFASQEWAEPYCSEINLTIKPWIKSISHTLKKGVIFLVDYGFPRQEYYHPDRNMGTLMCHYRHFAHSDPFLYPGLQDITAHVDFTAVAENALDEDLQILGYTHQAAFLIANNLTEEMNKASLKSPLANSSQAVNLLTSPSEMGELFKVMALGKELELDLNGFSLIDRRFSLG